MKKEKLLSLTMAATMIMSSALPVFAESDHNVDSVGSVAEDITNTTKVGQDTVQNQKSEYSDEITVDADTNACEAYLTKASTFSVVIPKTIVLDGSGKDGLHTGDYSITVKANMAGDDIISVVPDKEFNFKQDGKKDVLATVSQPKTTFQINDGLVTEENVEAGNTTTGTVSVKDISAGSWTGNFNFAIAINTGEAITN